MHISEMSVQQMTEQELKLEARRLTAGHYVAASDRERLAAVQNRLSFLRRAQSVNEAAVRAQAQATPQNGLITAIDTTPDAS